VSFLKASRALTYIMLLRLRQANFTNPAQALELKLRLLRNYHESTIQPFNEVRPEESSLPRDGARGFEIISDEPFLTGTDDHRLVMDSF